MKIIYNDLLNFLDKKPQINELSNSLFQLGHEHELQQEILDMEFTPNRGDCLSLKGLARDLNFFYGFKDVTQTYEGNIDELKIEFINKSPETCPKISFLQIEIEDTPKKYQKYIEDYFEILNVGKNNFFTDISNYLSYETGQPTHCFDAQKITEKLIFEEKFCNSSFETLLGTSVSLTDKNCVFICNNEIVSLAGVMGGKSTKCSKETKKVLIECAYFEPESIIGKSIKYNLNSDAAHKFERGVDISCQEKVLRRFAKIVSDHAQIKDIKIKTFQYINYSPKEIEIDLNKINNIIGTSIERADYFNYLDALFFNLEKTIQVPSFRNDISTQNDLAEEIARLIGYDNVENESLIMPKATKRTLRNNLSDIRNEMIMEGFTEVINYPFSPYKKSSSITVDNPLDSNKGFLRTSLKNSLLNNLLFNERRQKDSIKIFEISDIYSQGDEMHQKVMLGVLVSGRAGHNYQDFNKMLDRTYLDNFLANIFNERLINVEQIPRDSLDSKIKHNIFYFEIELDDSTLKGFRANGIKSKTPSFNQYVPISDYPSSNRDYSFLISDYSKYKDFIEAIDNLAHENLKESFIFDFYKNENNNQIKVGVRLIFQSASHTLSEYEINESVDKILDPILSLGGVSIPGM